MKASILEKNILSNKWGEYSEYIIEYTRTDGRKENQKREIQNNGNGAAVLLYNLEKKEIILIRQFRLATMLNQNPSGVIIEVCAGLVENDDPFWSIKKEIKEEIGIDIKEVDFLYKGYATPGAKTELIYFFKAEYGEINFAEFGGLKEEQEDIEVIKMKFDDAYEMIENGLIIDLKTISLLQYAKINLF
jgi:nudix-type nucleoside diphosphatase (YffH/AdpP family)